MKDYLVQPSGLIDFDQLPGVVSCHIGTTSFKASSGRAKNICVAAIQVRSLWKRLVVRKADFLSVPFSEFGWDACRLAT